MYAPQSARATVTSLILGRTGGYQEQYIRPYTVQANEHVKNQLIESLDPNRHISPASVGSNMASFIKPSTEVETSINLQMPNGWGQSRYRFALLLEIDTQPMGQLVQYITGYTEHDDRSLQSGHFDPNMRFYINASFQFRRDTGIHNGIPFTRLVPFTLNQVLTNSGYSLNNMSNSAMIRPQDVLNTIGLSPISDQILGAGGYSIDANTLTRTAAMSSVKNQNPANYLSRVLDAHRRAFNDEQAYGQAHDRIMVNAVDMVREDAQHTDPFLNLLINFSADSLIGNDFTFSQLQRIDPNVGHATKIFTGGSVQQLPNSFAQVSANDSEDWRTPGIMQQTATILRDSINSLMAENMFSSLAFSLTNSSPTGQFQYAFNGGTLFADADPAPFFQRFMDRFTHEIVPSVTFNNQVRFDLIASSEFVGDTRLNIQLDTKSAQFIAPTFCDSMTSPVIAGSQTRASELANNLSGVVSDIYNAFNSRSAKIEVPDSSNINLGTIGKLPF